MNSIKDIDAEEIKIYNNYKILTKEELKIYLLSIESGDSFSI